VGAVAITFTHLRFSCGGDAGGCAAGRFKLPVAPDT